MLILRREQFGGMVFNDKNAVQVSLNKKGFNLFRKNLNDPKLKFSRSEKSYLGEILKILEIKNTEPAPEIKMIKPVRSKKDRKRIEILSAPALADIQITTRCNLRCPHCYANSSQKGEHISWNDLILALDNFERAGVFQVALGGGEPTLHPQFKKIIKAVRDRGMVPNLTTNGRTLTADTAKAMAEYCGAIALSVEDTGKNFEKRRNFPWNTLCQSAELLKKYGNRLVFQITVSDSSINNLPKTIESLLEFSPYGIILLAYKPAGRGKFFDGVLAERGYDPIKNVLKECLKKIGGKTKIGFDCCFVQGIIELAKDNPSFDFKTIEGCSALRNSFAVTKNLDVVPCSFIDYSIGNIKEKSIESIWQGKKAAEFRNRFDKNIKKTPCKKCSLKYQCLGGCPEFSLVRCSKTK